MESATSQAIAYMVGYQQMRVDSEPNILCIPGSLVKDVLEIAHDVMGHGGYQKLLSRLDNVSIRNCTKRVKEYVRHCPDCLKNETRRHQQFGNDQPILSPDVPFHTITIDFMSQTRPTV
ncbi:hypothetical protein DPV78_002066 [Talaromyces pinophilus]|nr:hypothetical protein DPV78_002066 [Talaromyces pinophilus]